MTEKSEPKICLKCQHKNPAEAESCEKCGTALRPTTVPVPDIRKELEKQAEHPVAKTKTDDLVKQIALWVRNEPKPVLIPIGRGHVLGRKTSASDPPDLIDLTDYGAYRLGVSRRHAQFECTEEGSIVIDLGSSNGTWVNGLRLEPYQPASVKSGDRINLGRMEFSIGYALADAPPAKPAPETVAKTEPRIPAVPVPTANDAATTSGKVDTDPDPKLQAIRPVPESEPASPSSVKETAEDAKANASTDAKVEDSPAHSTQPRKPEGLTDSTDSEDAEKKTPEVKSEPPKSDA